MPAQLDLKEYRNIPNPIQSEVLQAVRMLDAKKWIDFGMAYIDGSVQGADEPGGLNVDITTAIEGGQRFLIIAVIEMEKPSKKEITYCLNPDGSAAEIGAEMQEKEDGHWKKFENDINYLAFVVRAVIRDQIVEGLGQFMTDKNDSID
ncbi:hypothetical protein IPJ72_00700 [Candidatus Peregrinibacteria bacterium]|nr:MAG: hypothetical protein IPJ72_00700 [Candidatus Peregrinibacteria bacterium]